MNKYRVLRAFAYEDENGKRVQTKLGGVVELSATQAKPLAKINAVGLYFEDEEDVGPAPESRAQKRKNRSRKPKEEAVEDAPVQD